MKIFFLLSLLTIANCYSYSQTVDPTTQKDNCLKKIAQERKNELDRLGSSYFEDNPNPSKYVYLACDNHFPKFRCVKHKKQCSGSCDCLSAYTNQANYISASYKQREDGCEQDYKVAIAKISSQTKKNQRELSKSENPLITNSPIDNIENGTETNNKTTEKQQYQNQANNYLNQAQNTNKSAISQQLNLDLAKTNAIMAGNQQQVQQIQQLQSQRRQESNEQLVNSAIGLFNSIQQASAIQRQRRAEYGAEDFRRAEAGDVRAMKHLAVEFALGNKYKAISKNRNQSIYWYSRAAALGDTCSLFEIATDIKLYSDELDDGTIGGSLFNLCTAYYLLTQYPDRNKGCDKYANARAIRKMIGQSLFINYPILKSDLRPANYVLLIQLFNERLIYLQNEAYGKEKRLGKKEVPVLKRYLTEIEGKLKEVDDADKQQENLTLDYFAAANVIPAFKRED